MDTVQIILNTFDPLLIYPYRLFKNPMTGWWVGTFCLAMWAVILGEITQAIANRVNNKAISANLDDTIYYHEQSMKAKQAGDDIAWQGINKLANEAYGKSFFLLMAMGMAGLWPAFFAAAWLDRRFGNINFVLPDIVGGFELSFLAPFILFYIFQRMTWAYSRKFLRWNRSKKKLWASPILPQRC